MLKRISAWLLVALVNLALIEAGFYLLIKNGLINTTFPTYKIQKRRFFGDYDPIHGAWHMPNSEFRHRTHCFDEVYSFNEVGAKDVYFGQSTEPNSVFLVGDSMVEGFGLSNNEALDSQIEAILGTSVLNFGTSGHFGTTQYSLIYEKYAPVYDHRAVVVVLTLANDLQDDSFAFGNKVHQQRYRPYRLRNTGPDYLYSLQYFGKAELESFKLEAKDYFSAFTSSYHIAKYVYKTYKTYIYEKAEAIERAEVDRLGKKRDEDQTILIRDFQRSVSEILKDQAGGHGLNGVTLDTKLDDEQVRQIVEKLTTEVLDGVSKSSLPQIDLQDDKKKQLIKTQIEKFEKFAAELQRNFNDETAKLQATPRIELRNLELVNKKYSESLLEDDRAKDDTLALIRENDSNLADLLDLVIFNISQIINQAKLSNATPIFVFSPDMGIVLKGESEAESSMIKNVLYANIDGATFVDPHNEFMQQEDKRELFHECDGHLSAKGAKLLATVINRFLK